MQQYLMDHPVHRPNRLPSILFFLFALIGIFLVYRAWKPRALASFAQARSNPAQTIWQDGDWYWLEPAEKTEKPIGARLIRAGNSGAQSLADAENITVFAIAGKQVAWTAKEGSNWTINAANTDGSSKKSLWSGAQEPHGLYLAEGKAYWLEQAPAIVPNSGPLPPLAGSLRLLSVAVEGGEPAPVATLMEPEGVQVLGVHAGNIYVSAFRPGDLGATAFYRIPLAGGTSERVASESGRQQGLLTRNGVLYWTAPGQEDNRRSALLCVRRLGDKANIETLTDWLPLGGHLYDTEHGVFYVDGSYLSEAWRMRSEAKLARPVSQPRDTLVLAVGGSEMLLKGNGLPLTNFPVYRVPLP